MPQGSRTGRLGYTKYTGPLGYRTQMLCILYHLFANEEHIHKSLDPSSITSQFSAKSAIESYISKKARCLSIALNLTQLNPNLCYSVHGSRLLKCNMIVNRLHEKEKA